MLLLTRLSLPNRLSLTRLSLSLPNCHEPELLLHESQLLLHAL